MQLHRLIRKVRDAKGLTAAELARRAAIDDVHLARFEKGEKLMGSAKLERLLVALELSVSWVDQDGVSSTRALDGLPEEEPSAAA